MRVAIETDFQKRSKDGVIFDRVQLKMQRQKKRDNNRKQKQNKNSNNSSNNSDKTTLEENEVKYPEVDLKFAFENTERTNDSKFHAKFNITVLNEMPENTVKDLLDDQLTNIFNGYTIDPDIRYDKDEEHYAVHVTGSTHDGTKALDKHTIRVMISLLNHFLSDSFDLDTYVGDNIIIMLDKTGKHQQTENEIKTTGKTGEPISAQFLLDDDRPFSGINVFLKLSSDDTVEVTEGPNRVGVNAHNKHRAKHVNTPDITYDQSLCADAQSHADLIASKEQILKT